MIIKIPDDYTNLFRLKGENTDLMHAEARLVDLLGKELENEFNSFLLRYEYWICEQLEKAYMEGSKAGIQAARQADSNENTITFRFRPD